MRIHVTGNCGSGKTTLAKQLQELTGLPLLQMDSLVWQPNWQPTPADIRDKTEKEWAGEAQWIIEGVSRHARKNADLIVFLDFPWPLCLYRALKRTWELRHSNRAELTSCSERNAFWPLLKTLWLYQKTTRKRILSELQDKSHVRFRMPSQLARWQNTVLSSGKPVVLGCEGQAGNSSQRRKS